MTGRTICLVAIAYGVFFGGGCKEPQPIQPIDSRTYFSFLDKGAVVPEPVETVVAIDRDDILSITSQNGVPIRTWSRKIDSRDYILLVSVVENNGLLGAPDVRLTTNPCVGMQELVVVIAFDGVA